MKEYFKLQYRMLNRKLIDFGMPLLIAYTILPIVFIWFSKYLFSKIEFAGYIYLFVALSLISRMSEPQRNDFLKSIFSKQHYLTLRLAENVICGIPFLAFLIYKQFFLFSLALVLLSILMTLFNFSVKTDFAIPTPFGKRPFEFPLGFRKTFFVFPMAYLLTFISIRANNFNLGIFSMFLVTLVCLSYYSKPENEYFVWNFSTSSKTFLLEKIKTCFIYFTPLSLPIIIPLSIVYFENVTVLAGFILLSYIYLTAIILAKYSAYPNEMNLFQGILIAISLMFPPILIGVIPLFYSQSIKNLNPILNDSN